MGAFELAQIRLHTMFHGRLDIAGGGLGNIRRSGCSLVAVEKADPSAGAKELALLC